MTTINLTTTSGELELAMEEDRIVSANLSFMGRPMTSSYLEGGAMFLTNGDDPDGVIWPMTEEEIGNLRLVGGKVRLFAEDLFLLTVIPEWWGVECQMAIEEDAPEWPLAEDAKEDAGDSIFGSIMGFLRLMIEDDDDDWDTPPEEG